MNINYLQKNSRMSIYIWPWVLDFSKFKKDWWNNLVDLRNNLNKKYYFKNHPSTPFHLNLTLNRASFGKCLRANSLWQVYLGSVLRSTACPYPGTTCPDFSVFQMNSLSWSSVTSSPTCALSFCSQMSTSWLARPWRGPARPLRPAP